MSHCPPASPHPDACPHASGARAEHGPSDAERGIGRLAMLAGVCVFLVGVALMLSAAIDVLDP